MVGTGLFSMEEAARRPGWRKSVAEWERHAAAAATASTKGGKEVAAPLGEAEEYGISSMVYRANRPFHPARLYRRFFSARLIRAHTRTRARVDATRICREQHPSPLLAPLSLSHSEQPPPTYSLS